MTGPSRNSDSPLDPQSSHRFRLGEWARGNKTQDCFSWQVKSAYEPSGPSGRSLSRFLQHEATRSISTSPSQVTPSIKFAGNHLYTWVKRGTVRVKCLAHEHNAMSPARSRARVARSGVEWTNHDATAPPTVINSVLNIKFKQQLMSLISKLQW